MVEDGGEKKQQKKKKNRQNGRQKATELFPCSASGPLYINFGASAWERRFLIRRRIFRFGILARANSVLPPPT